MEILAEVERRIVGGASIARLDLKQTARLMIDLAHAAPSGRGPLFLSSANGEVLARRHFDPQFARLLDRADLLNADGQAMIFASNFFTRRPLPERVATTDLYPVVAGMAQEEGVSFFLFGATEEVNRATFNTTRRQFPRLDLRGRSHGYVTGDALKAKLAEINALAPDILWLSLGVPREQEFVVRYAHLLPKVKMIKTSGGLFDFLSGAKKRAPLWIQKAGLEWAYRLGLEPRRLALRYLTTNPVAVYLLLTQTR
jgi:N-acetylglucosaminyldiphosphoundecaprenol N-acetyl-beta-D-mannosaminyltransferase